MVKEISGFENKEMMIIKEPEKPTGIGKRLSKSFQFNLFLKLFHMNFLKIRNHNLEWHLVEKHFKYLKDV